eukprot:1966811-Rhodomonas_salina.3
MTIFLCSYTYAPMPIFLCSYAYAPMPIFLCSYAYDPMSIFLCSYACASTPIQAILPIYILLIYMIMCLCSYGYAPNLYAPSSLHLIIRSYAYAPTPAPGLTRRICYQGPCMGPLYQGWVTAYNGGGRVGVRDWESSV